MKSIKEIDYLLEPGYVYLSRDNSVIRTVLGSCVSVCLWDKVQKYGGINHFLYPAILDKEKATPKYGNVATAALINYMYVTIHGGSPPRGEVYSCAENPKGELGFYIQSDGGPEPLRLKIRGPSFVNLGLIPLMAEGSLMSDIIAAIGSIDICLGEVDR